MVVEKMAMLMPNNNNNNIIIIFLESHSAGHAGFFFDGSAELVIL